MRIAYVTETFPPELNGVALTVARTVAHLRDCGHEVDLIRPRQDGESIGPGHDEWRSHGWPIPVYPELRFGVALPSQIAARLSAARPQVVHVATEGPLGWAAVSAARRLGVPTTSDFRTNFHQYCHYYRLGWTAPGIGAYLRCFHNRTRRSFAPTGQVRRALFAAGFQRVEVVGRGVDGERFTPAMRDPALRARWGMSDAPALLYVGRLAPEKNVELALRAYESARRFVPAARMIVVGDGPLRRRLERAHPEVHFTGTLSGDALVAHYASADIFLFPSLTDTFGNVTLEALACGVPVVAFDLGAASEHVADRVNGRLVPAGDEQGFVISASLLTAQYRELEPMRREARNAALLADWQSVLHGFEDQLADVAYAHERTRSRIACAA
jgi:glycosyltransferase involved in cell wall biosynthesis